MAASPSTSAAAQQPPELSQASVAGGGANPDMDLIHTTSSTASAHRSRTESPSSRAATEDAVDPHHKSTRQGAGKEEKTGADERIAAPPPPYRVEQDAEGKDVIWVEFEPGGECDARDRACMC